MTEVDPQEDTMRDQLTEIIIWQDKAKGIVRSDEDQLLLMQFQKSVRKALQVKAQIQERKLMQEDLSPVKGRIRTLSVKITDKALIRKILNVIEQFYPGAKFDDLEIVI